ncbi:MAG: uridine kinase, partial [Flavobacteriales bacterium]
PEGSCAMLDHDAYYKDLAHLPVEERAATNFDHPDSLENTLLESHLGALRRGEAVDKPVYDFATHSRASEVVHIEPAPIVVLEGILVLADPAVRAQMDIKLFVDTDDDVRLMRRIRRDMSERGRTFEDVREQYYRTVRPMHIEYVAPSRRHADLIIPEGGENNVAVGVVVRSILGALNERTA